MVRLQKEGSSFCGHHLTSFCQDVCTVTRTSTEASQQQNAFFQRQVEQDVVHVAFTNIVTKRTLIHKTKIQEICLEVSNDFPSSS